MPSYITLISLFLLLLGTVSAKPAAANLELSTRNVSPLAKRQCPTCPDGTFCGEFICGEDWCVECFANFKRHDPELFKKGVQVINSDLVTRSIENDRSLTKRQCPTCPDGTFCGEFICGEDWCVECVANFKRDDPEIYPRDHEMVE